MRLATITNWAYGATVALTLASATFMLLASQAQERERAVVAERYSLDQATSHVDRDVAALSGLARQYAISGDMPDLIAYQREQQVLGTIENRVRHIQDAGARPGELRALVETLRWADALHAQQQAAIAARRSGDRIGALAILFAPEYARELDRIQASVERFQEQIDSRTGFALDAASVASRLWRHISEAVLAATGLLFLCVLFFVFRQRVLRPVVRLSDVVTRLAAQDYAVEPPDYDRIDEIGDMAQALRVFRENGIMRQQLEQERDIDRALRDLLSRMTQRMQGADSVHDLERIVERFVPALLPQLAGRLYLLEAERNALVETCAWLDPTASVAEFPPTACWALRRGGEHRVTGGLVDVPCSHLGPASTALPATICVPLAAQSGTLGLLYFELRAGFAMADVPDALLKMLAENIGLAVDNLRLRNTLRDLAMADPLTTLANRRHLDAVFDRHAPPSTASLSCIMIDIDHFKRFNDQHGHEAGDAVLRAVGKALKESIRAEDMAFRYGGEEFLILMPGVAHAKAVERAEEILSCISGLRIPYAGRDLGPVTVSAGVASAPLQCPHDRLIHTADAALLEAKRAGRNRIVAA